VNQTTPVSEQHTTAEGFQETAVVSVVEGEFQVQLPPPSQNEYLDFLVGDWVGYYNMAGMHFDVKATTKWVYNHQYVQGLNQSTGPIGTVESQEMWQATQKDGVFRLFYFDPFGGAGLGEAIWAEDGFLIIGDDESTGPFRNTVTVRGNDELIFRLDLGPDAEGQYRTIGHGHYERVKA